MKYQKISLDLIDLNEGQIPGLPRNPRSWTYEDMKRLQNSILESPELFEVRGLIVYPFNDRYVVIGGNMRLSAAKEMRLKQAPCVILPEETSIEKLQEMVIKDNGSFGRWDESLLTMEWSDCPFAEWGVDLFEEAESEQPKSSLEKDSRSVFAVTFESDEFMFVKERLGYIDSEPEKALLKLLGYGKESKS